MQAKIFKVAPKIDGKIEFSKDLGTIELSVDLSPAQKWIARDVMTGIEVHRLGNGFRLTLTRSAFDRYFKIV